MTVRSLTLLVTLAGAWCGSAGCDGGAGTGAAVDAGVDAVEGEPCPTAPLGPDLARSGTRLCARFEVAPGGARKLIGFRDRVLGIDCAIDRTSPTTARCLPPMQELEAYADAACTEPLYVGGADPTCAPPRFVGHASTDACPHGQVDQVFAIGAEVFPTVIHRRHDDGTCGVDSASPTSHYFAVTPVALDRFATAHRVDDAAAPGRLHASRWQGDDGSSSAWFLRDELLETDCYTSTVDGARRCRPVSMGPNTFSDSACTSPIGGVDDECVNATPGVLENPAFVSDQFTRRLYRRGVAVAPGTLYLGGGNTCTPIAARPGVRYFQAGAEVEAASLAPYEYGPRTTGARIEPYAYSAGADPIVDDGELYDALLDGRCRAGLAVDGSRRCIPDGDLSLAHLYADPQCQSPAVVLTISSSVTWVPNQLAVETTTTADACPSERHRVVRRGAERTTPLYYDAFVGGPQQHQCMPAPGTYWDVGPDVAPAEMVPIDIVEQ